MYAVAKFDGYGRLSGKRLADLRAGARVEIDESKRDPLDFVLWQAAQPGEPSWDSPWGKGRPGWHIECSAMSTRYLGDVVDIHGGGSDLIFPHHSCEIAQTEHYSGVHPFVRCWLHTGMVRLDGVKMSKSLGNLVMAREVLSRAPADAMRLYLSNHHYREGWDWLDDEFTLAVGWARELVAAADCGGAPGRPRLDAGPYVARFVGAMEDDLNTTAAIAALRELGQEVVARANSHDVADAAQTVRDLGGNVLGLTFKG